MPGLKNNVEEVFVMRVLAHGSFGAGGWCWCFFQVEHVGTRSLKSGGLKTSVQGCCQLAPP